MFEKIKEIIANKLGVDPDDITPETNADDLGADSLDAIEIVIDIEVEFGIDIPDSELCGSDRTVGALVSVIEKNSYGK
ncbi:MAG TPA: acyl carrier protein [Methylomusa anaerophila]|uniref:Acyl carrier protein n=1 Tax=Methylomusa anaerophila TaxID=1930071 RepID=A0A348AIX8_9FIRM|nr:acyl carrier protein [Methylomusa anaerophila]BBB91026.1 acyl carrier protein [Methylomusa anaerophila]HML88896.1 acyl carrier protein [Methylomusa anaerophila]